MTLEHLDADSFRCVFDFVENDYVPVFRQVCRIFKEISDWEVERDEGLIYNYFFGKLKKHRSKTPIYVNISRYVITEELFEWARIKGGYKFSDTLEHIGDGKKSDERYAEWHYSETWVDILFRHGCKELIFKYCLDFIYEVQGEWLACPRIGLTGEYVRRWNSVQDITDYEQRLRLDIHHPIALGEILDCAICSDAPIEVVSWLVDVARCDWITNRCVLNNVICERNVDFLDQVFIKWGGEIDAILLKRDRFRWELVECSNRGSLDNFKYLFNRFKTFHPSFSDKFLLSLLESCTITDIFDFLEEENVINRELVRSLTNHPGRRINIVAALWMMKKHQIIVIDEDISLDKLNYKQEEAVLEFIDTRFITDELLVNYVLIFAISGSCLQLLDKVLNIIVERQKSRKSILVLKDICHDDIPLWHEFKSLNHFIRLINISTVSPETFTSGDVKRLQTRLVKDNAFDFLSWMYENGYPMLAMNKLNYHPVFGRNKRRRDFFEQLTSVLQQIDSQE